MLIDGPSTIGSMSVSCRNIPITLKVSNEISARSPRSGSSYHNVELAINHR